MRWLTSYHRKSSRLACEQQRRAIAARRGLLTGMTNIGGKYRDLRHALNTYTCTSSSWVNAGDAVSPPSASLVTVTAAVFALAGFALLGLTALMATGPLKGVPPAALNMILQPRSIQSQTPSVHGHFVRSMETQPQPVAS